VTATDVLVVGAGPAGSVAALLLARAGVRVRLIDRERFPRHKLCGDTLNPGALSILDALDAGPLRSARCPLASAVRSAAIPISGMTVTGPHGACVTADYPDGLRGASLTRRDLDQLLVEAAVDAGASFDEGISALAPMAVNGRVTGVRVATRAGQCEWPAGVVLAADGRASRMATALGLSRFSPRVRRWAFGAYFSGVSGLDRHGEMHVRADRYIGVAPVPGGLANVCVVRSMAGSARKSLDRNRVIADALAAEPLLRGRFAGARQETAVTTLGPLSVDSSGSGRPGLLLAGDAAGFVDPMTGDGLRFALRGGVLAAEAALSELSSGRPAFAALHAARAVEFSSKWRINRALRSLAGSPASIAAAAWIAERWASPVRMLIGVAGDVGLARAQAAGRAADRAGGRSRLAAP
jgi:flavin-dependent dehydrogenase